MLEWLEATQEDAPLTTPRADRMPKEAAMYPSPQNHPAYLWWQGRQMAWDEATIHVTSLGWTGISAVFEGIRAYWNAEQQRLHVFAIDAHLKRLAQSMKLVRMTSPYSSDEIKQAALSLLRDNELEEDSYIFPLAYFPSGIPGYLAVYEQPGEVVLTTRPRESSMLTGRALHCNISSWRRISDNTMPPRAKMTTNYQNSRFVSTEASINGYDTAIILNDQGKVAESPYACVFIVRDGVAYTPPVTAGVLESITRDIVMQLLQEELGVPCRERDVDRTEMYIADEAFLCGTFAEITPIASVDCYVLGSGTAGPITSRLEQLFHDIVRGKDDRYAELRTVV